MCIAKMETEHDKYNSWDSNQSLLNDEDWKYSL